MKEVLYQDARRKDEIIRDEHDTSGRYVFRTTLNHDPYLRKNERIRKEGLMPKNHKLPALGEGESVECIMAFRIPPDEFAFFRRLHPDIMEMIQSSDEATRIRGAKQLQILHPEWVVTEGHR